MPLHNLFDHTLKIIARNYADIFLRLAFPDTPVRLLGTLENVELALPIRPVDFVHRVRYADQEYLFHAEFQWQHDVDFPRRVCTYHGLLTEQFQLPVLTLVLYLRPRQMDLPAAYEVRMGEAVVNRFQYPVLRLWDYVDAIRDGTYYALAPLLLELAPAAAQESLLAEERALIQREPDAQKRADLLALAVAVATRHFDRRYLWQFFTAMEVQAMQEATFFEDLFANRMEQVKAQFLQQGQLTGARKANQERILDVLIARFNPPVAQYRRIEKRLETISDLETLRALLIKLVTVDDVAAFETALQAAVTAPPSE